MTRGLKILTIVAAAIIIPGGLWAGIGIYALQQICYSVVKYNINSIDFVSKKIDINFTVMIKNPSHLNVTIGGYDISVALNGTEVARLINDHEKIIEAKKTSILILPVKIDVLKTFNQVKSKEIIGYFATKDYEKIVISLNGKFNGKIIKLPISIKVNSQYTFAEIIKQMDEPSTPC